MHFCPLRAPLAAVAALAVAATLAVVVLPPAAQAQAPAGANPSLPRVTIQAGMHLIRAEVAETPAARATGLMNRTALGPNEGMLFVFQDKGVHCFWMRNTLIPLSIAFVDDDGAIVNIADMQPHSEDSHCPRRAVRYALEMEQGWFARRGLADGARLASPPLFGPKK